MSRSLKMANLAAGTGFRLFGLLRLIRGFRPLRFRFFFYGKSSPSSGKVTEGRHSGYLSSEHGDSNSDGRKVGVLCWRATLLSASRCALHRVLDERPKLL